MQGGSSSSKCHTSLRSIALNAMTRSEYDVFPSPPRLSRQREHHLKSLNVRTDSSRLVGGLLDRHKEWMGEHRQQQEAQGPQYVGLGTYSWLICGQHLASSTKCLNHSVTDQKRASGDTQSIIPGTS